MRMPRNILEDVIEYYFHALRVNGIVRISKNDKMCSALLSKLNKGHENLTAIDLSLIKCLNVDHLSYKYLGMKQMNAKLGR